ncbi:unnamed protein product, partial [Ascophyllum nodosum]
EGTNPDQATPSKAQQQQTQREKSCFLETFHYTSGEPNGKEPHHYSNGKINRRFLDSRASRRLSCLCFS